MNRWPAIRTSYDRPQHLRIRAAAIGAIGACLIPFLCGLLALATGYLIKIIGGDELAGEGLIAFAAVLIPSLFLSMPSTLVAVPAALIALRYGRAGWLVAVVASALMTLLLFGVVLGIRTEGLPVAFGVGAVFGAIFWVCARISTPGAFMSEPAVAGST